MLKHESADSPTWDLMVFLTDAANGSVTAALFSSGKPTVVTASVTLTIPLLLAESERARSTTASPAVGRRLVASLSAAVKSEVARRSLSALAARRPFVLATRDVDGTAGQLTPIPFPVDQITPAKKPARR